MSFDATWLALREPADQAARAPALLTAFADAVGKDATILDIGCGTGSTLRSVAPHLKQTHRWILADNDPALLAKAAHHAETLLLDLNAPLPATDFITASALFDLCSPEFIASFAARITASGLYAALNYDGQIAFDTSHPQDAEVTAAFNQHQTRDKGFGPAAGPKAAHILAQACKNNGFTVQLSQSDWHLPPSPLQSAFLQGVAAAAAEIGVKTTDWLNARLTSGGSCRVGHLDLLALRQRRGGTDLHIP